MLIPNYKDYEFFEKLNQGTLNAITAEEATCVDFPISCHESTGQFGADTRSGGLVQSASHSPAATLRVPFDVAKVRTSSLPKYTLQALQSQNVWKEFTKHISLQ